MIGFDPSEVNARASQAPDSNIGNITSNRLCQLKNKYVSKKQNYVCF